VDWKLAGRGFSLDVTVPVSCQADIRLPATATATVVESGRHHFTAPATETPSVVLT
jgi:hypothetical protein